MRFYILLILSLLIITGCSQEPKYIRYNPTDYVDAFIGTANNGNATPGATTPWGMVTMTPLNIEPETFVCKEKSRLYQNGNEFMYGFSHTAIADVDGCQSGNIIIAPVFGDIRWRPDDRKYHYSMEMASPGYYKVKLDEDLIFAELTATRRTGLSRFRFQNGWGHIVLDLSATDALVRITAPNEIVGYQYKGPFCGTSTGKKVYFVAQFDRTAMGGGLFKGDTLYPDTVTELAGKGIGAVFSFRTLDGSEIHVKTGISYVSIENARENLMAEQPNFSFSLIRQRALEQWEKELSKILVYGGSDDHKKMFYTALYRSLHTPHIFQDVNGEYPILNGDDTVGKVEGMNRYSVFALPTTYQTQHPLLTAFYPSRQIDMLHSMVGLLLENGSLPNFELHGHEIGTTGQPAALVIADSYVKGLSNFDINKAYSAIIRRATQHDGNPIFPGLASYETLGYIPYDKDQEENNSNDKVRGSVSTTLEFALADWSIAQLAKALDKKDDYDFFIKRSQNYVNLFDAETGFFRARLQNGEWLQPFNPMTGLRHSGTPAGAGYAMGSAWNYAFFVPHDSRGLIELLGEDQFVTRLQTLFENNYFDVGIGADLAYPFLFNYIHGEEWRTTKTVRQVIANNFGADPNGLPDNENPDALSSWLVWAMLGLYPDCPASNLYQLSTPFFNRIEIDLDQENYPGDKFIIETPKLSDENMVITSIKLNGQKQNAFTLTHADLANGGTLQINTSDKK